MYNRILLPTDGTSASEELIRFICSLQGLKSGEIHVACIVEVPRSLPLNECPPDMQSKAYATVQKAESIASELKATVITHVIYARTFEDSLLSTAELLKCDTIGIAQNNQKLKLFANMALNVYQRAKCNVWLINFR